MKKILQIEVCIPVKHKLHWMECDDDDGGVEDCGDHDDELVGVKRDGDCGDGPNRVTEM